MPCLVPTPYASVPPHLCVMSPPHSLVLSPVLSRPQLLLCPGDGDGLVQRGWELWGSWECLSTARTPRKPPSTSREWGDTVCLRPQPDLPQQQLPPSPQQIAPGFVSAAGEVCPGPSERHGGC